MGTVAGKVCQKGEESVDLTFPPSSFKGQAAFWAACQGWALSGEYQTSGVLHSRVPDRAQVSPLSNGEGDPGIGQWIQIALEQELWNFEFQHFWKAGTYTLVMF